MTSLVAVELLILDLADEVLTGAEDDDDLVEARAVAHELSVLQCRTEEAFLAVDVELGIQLGHLRDLDSAEVRDLRAAWEGSPVALDEVLVTSGWCSR